MDKSYSDLKRIADRAYEKLEREGHPGPFASRVLALLGKYDIKPRQKDGNLSQLNISIPSSVKNGVVVGLRYTKQNGTKTEDLFLFRADSPIAKGYKGNLEKILREYKETHKLQR